MNIKGKYMKKSNKCINNETYICKSAINDLPMFAKDWIQKHLKKIPIKVPVRRNCMTGSGENGACHWNVSELVKKYGGSKLQGFAVNIFDLLDFRYLEITNHSVWITPECKTVDVTAHNYSSNNEYQFFIPIVNGGNHRVLSTIIVAENYKKTGLLVDMRDDGINKGIADGCKYQLSRHEYGTFVRIPASKFVGHLLYSYDTDVSIDNFHEYAKGNFSLPSTSTGKYWHEIVGSSVHV